jgi:sulfatase maturation enzyme AslB (radical SAM superfamily)
MTSIRNNGDFRVCCHSNVSKGQGIIKDINGKTLNIKNDSINSSRNTPILKEIRNAMINGRDHEACIRCINEESNGIKSRREFEIEKSKNIFNSNQIIEKTQEDGSINVNDIPIKNLDIRFGNKCNLKCRMCGPTDSDAWYSDYVNLWNGNTYTDTHGEVTLEKAKVGWKPKNDDYNWVESDFVWKELIQKVNELTYIHCVGGEPLLIEDHFTLLEMCVKVGAAKNIILEYNTNGTLIPEKAWPLWKEFKEVKIGVSIDGYGPVNDYIRDRSKWKMILNNLNKLNEAEGNYNVWLSFTVQALNIIYLPELIKWKLTSNLQVINGYTHKRIISTHPLHSPKYLSVKMLPAEVKEQIAEQFLELKKWFNEWIEVAELKEDLEKSYRSAINKIVDGYINFMNSEDLTEHFDKFCWSLNKLDILRSQSFEKSLPEFAKLIQPYISDNFDEYDNLWGSADLV